MVYLEFHEGTSSKFWQIEVAESNLTVTFGKIGTNGQSQIKTFESPEAAQKEAEKLAATKRKKGYVDVSKDAPPQNAAEIEKRQGQLALLAQKFAVFVSDNSPQDEEYYHEALKMTLGDIKDETGLYNLAVKQPALRPAVLKVFDAMMTAFEGDNILWVDDETQAGLTLSESFALANKADVPMMTRFINLCDIDHGVDIDERVVGVWNKWGFCPETCDLIVSFMLRDQNGESLPQTLDGQKEGISALLQEEKAANMVLASIRNWLDSDVPWAKNYHRSEHALKNEIPETLAPLFSSLFQIDSIEAEESAEKYAELYINGKTPKINQIYKKSAPLQKGTEEQMYEAVMGAMDGLGAKVYEKARKNEIELNLDSMIGLAKPTPERKCIVKIDGEKYNRMQNYVNGPNNVDGYGLMSNFATVKFEGMDYSGIPDSFYRKKLIPALVKWAEKKIDTQAYPNLYGGRMKVCFGATDSGLGWVETIVDHREQLKEWLATFLEALKNKDFVNWTCEEFGADVNLWILFALVDQLGSGLVAEFIATVNAHVQKEHPEGKPCVQTDILPYMQAYYEEMEKEEMGKEKAEGFLQILNEANIFYKHAKGKNLPFYKKAKEFAENAN